jgi:hypothetical protein
LRAATVVTKVEDRFDLSWRIAGNGADMFPT